MARPLRRTGRWLGAAGLLAACAGLWPGAGAAAQAQVTPGSTIHPATHPGHVADAAAPAAATAAAPVADPPPAAVDQAAPAARPLGGLPDFAALVRQVGPSVVHIRVVRAPAEPAEAQPGSDEAMQELLRRHFAPREGSPAPGGGGEPLPEERAPAGVGAGFVLSADGLLLTNAHVVERAGEVRVRLPDAREFTARVLGADRRSDVAVLRIEADGLVPVRFGDPARLEAGDWVIAIGSPFGLDSTVTAGIVSAKSRDTGELLPLIQTDVAINPGNSGGPLINLRGEVVGMNSQIYSRSGGYQGIAFAIPSDEVRRIAQQLREQGRVRRSRIGVRIAEVGPALARSLGLSQAQGALVQASEPGGPGERAGLEPGDVITRFGGQPVRRSADLPRLVADTPPGSRHAVQVFRRGSYRELVVAVAEIAPEASAPQPAATPSPPPVRLPAQAAGLGLGLEILPPSARTAQRIGHGLRVVSVAEGSLAARAGLREGDLLLRLDDTDLRSPAQADEALARHPSGQPLRLLAQRAGVAGYLLIGAGAP